MTFSLQSMSLDRFCPHATIRAWGAMARRRLPYTLTISAYFSGVKPLFIGSLSIWKSGTP